MKNKGTVRRSLAAILALIMAVALAACGAAKPEDTVKKGLDALKAGDRETALSCFDSKAGETLDSEESEKGPEDLLYSKMSYTIKDVQADKDTATVKTEIETLDMNKVLEKAMTELMQLAMGNIGGQDMSEAEMTAKTEEILLKYMKETTDKSVKTVDVQLKLDKDAWQIQTSDELMDALTGGLGSLGSALGGTD